MKLSVSKVVRVCVEASTGCTTGAGTAGVLAAVVLVAVVVVGGFEGLAAGAGAEEDAAVDVAAGCSTAGTGFFIRSGKSFGATAAQSQRKPIEISTAAKILFSISRDGVPTSRIERVAAGKTPQAEPDAAQCAVLFDRLHHENGAGGIEAAHRRQQR
jgi:hypothetical protein